MNVVFHYYSSWKEPLLHVVDRSQHKTTDIFPLKSIGVGRSPQEHIFEVELTAGISFFLTFEWQQDRPGWDYFYTIPSFPSALIDGEFHSLPYHFSPSFRMEWQLKSKYFEAPFFLRFFAPRLREEPIPLLILNDGQNQWKEHGILGGWHSDTTTLELMKQGRIPDIYLLAIDHPIARNETYLPTFQAEDYIQFIAEELVPNLKKKYKISSIAIVGSSYGGVNALYAGMQRPDVFSQVGCLSYAKFSQDPMPKLLQQKPLKIEKLYFDAGTRWTEKVNETRNDYQELTEDLISIIQRRNPGLVIHYHVAKGHVHNEKYWRKRFPGVLKFLFSS